MFWTLPGLKGLAANSIETNRRDLKEFSAFIHRLGKVPSAVEREDVRAFLKQLYDRGLGPRSVPDFCLPARFFRFLGREGQVTGDPTADVEAPSLISRYLSTFG